MRRFCIVALCVVALATYVFGANATVTGNIRGVLGSTSVAKRPMVRFTLQNYGGNAPYTAAGTLGQLSTDLVACTSTLTTNCIATDGTLTSVTVAGNDEITPSGTYYTLEFYSNGIFQSAVNCIINTPSFSLNTRVGCSRASVPKGLTPVAGSTSARPTAASAGIGTPYFDTTLDLPVWSDGTNWKDATGTVR